jgi:tRNA-splicing ligase RtcB
MKETQVLIHAKIIDSATHDQIKLMAKSPAFYGLIAIMPDCHLGVGSCIGFTGKFNKCVIPNTIGVDIGCGVASYSLGNVDIDFELLDKFIRDKIPLGFNSQPDEKYLKDLTLQLKANCENINNAIITQFYEKTYKKYIQPISQLGTLGGGNHFIEIESDKENNKFLTVHTGSRNLGQKVATYYQNAAKEFHLKLPENKPISGLEYLPLEFGGNDYLIAMRLAQQYAQLNREVIIQRILKFFNIKYTGYSKIESTHNFVSERDNIIRKGAISAHKGEQVIIPLNMRDGVVLGIGKGNSSYNNSAPHGAGRVFGRSMMKEQLRTGVVTMEQFKEEMKNIYSTSVNQDTIDESPFAYKSFEDIKEYLEETVEITNILKPVYNLKAGGD